MPEQEGSNSIGVFWPTFWLSLVFIGVKGTYVLLSAFWTWARPRDYVSWLYFKWLASASQADVLFALGSGVLAGAALTAVRRLPVVWRWVARVHFALALVFVLYAIIGRQLFSYYHAPMTYQLLALAGRPDTLFSSFEPYLTRPFITAMVLVPALFAVLTWVMRRAEASLAPVVMRSTRGIAVVGILAWLAIGGDLLSPGRGWFTFQDRYLPDSPHWTFVRSALARVIGGGAMLAATELRDDELADFARPAATAPSEPFSNLGSTNIKRPRNVILIVLESVGTPYLGLYGSKLVTTPTLVAEQNNAIVFDSYYTPVAWTANSLLALVLSQRPPLEFYSEQDFEVGSKLDENGVVGVLAAHGFRTGFLAAGDPAWASKGILDRSGFQTIKRGTELTGAVALTSWGTEDRELFDAMLHWIKSDDGRPFFLMGWTEQTHNPYTLAPHQEELTLLPDDAPVRTEMLSRYLTLLRAVDAQLGRLFEFLRATGLAEDTLVVITGDHGEAFGEPHGTKGHGFSVYEEEVRVPLMLWNPRLFGGVARSQAVGSHVDLAPTILGILGIPPPQGWDGRSLFDTSRPPRTYLFAAAWGQYLLGVREGDWKYIYDVRSDREELYDLSADPSEQHNTAQTEPGRAARLRRRLAAWLHVERLRTGARQ